MTATSRHRLDRIWRFVSACSTLSVKVDVPRAIEIVNQLEADLSRSSKLPVFENGFSSFELCSIEAGEVVGRHGPCVS